MMPESATPQVTGEVTPQVTPQVKNLLQQLEVEVSREELMDKLSLRDREHFRKNYLLPALQAEVIEMTIPDKPQSSKQKYRITEKGQRALKERADKQGRKG